MRRGVVFAIALVSATMALTGCSETEAAKVNPNATYSGLDELRGAYQIAAGVDCGTFSGQTIDPRVKGYAISSCGSRSSLIVVTSDEMKGRFAHSVTVEPGQAQLVGPNWIIVSDQYEVEAAQAKMGGEIAAK